MVINSTERRQQRGSIALSGRISGENHPFVEHFKFVKQFEEEGVTARQTIPAPAQLLQNCSEEITQRIR